MLIFELILKPIRFLKRAFIRWQKRKWPSIYGPNVYIAERVSVGEDVLFQPYASITIGNDTMIASRAVFCTATHDYDVHPMRTFRIDRPIEIGSYVWIGTGAIILPGLKIGDYSVVAAGSVVTAHVPECSIVAGNPARVIKTRDIKSIQKFRKFPPTMRGKILFKGFHPEDKVCENLSSGDLPSVVGD